MIEQMLTVKKHGCSTGGSGLEVDRKKIREVRDLRKVDGDSITFYNDGDFSVCEKERLY